MALESTESLDRAEPEAVDADPGMAVMASRDVPNEVRAELIQELRQVLAVDREDIPLLNAHGEVVSGFLQILGTVAKWSPLRVAATTFLLAFSKKAGTEIAKRVSDPATWRAGTESLRSVVNALLRATRKAPRPVKIRVGLPIFDGLWGTSVECAATDEITVAWTIANFIVRAERIVAVMDEEIAAGNRPADFVLVDLLENGSLRLHWPVWNEGYTAFRECERIIAWEEGTMWCEFCRREVLQGTACPQTGAAHKTIPTAERVREETEAERRQRTEES